MTSTGPGISLTLGQAEASQRRYRVFAPGPYLAASIECFWTGTMPAAPRKAPLYRVLPDKCMDLLFDLTPAGNQRASVIGTMTRPLIFAAAGPVDVMT